MCDLAVVWREMSVLVCACISILLIEVDFWL